MASEILVGSYLLERLRQLGLKTIFGVPGGTCLTFDLHVIQLTRW